MDLGESTLLPLDRDGSHLDSPGLWWLVESFHTQVANGLGEFCRS